MEVKPFYTVPHLGRVSVWQMLPNDQRREVATNLSDTQAAGLATTLNHLHNATEDARTVMRRQRAQLVQVGRALFALVREVLVVEGPPVEIKCTDQFAQRWNEAMEVLLILSSEGIPTA